MSVGSSSSFAFQSDKEARDRMSSSRSSGRRRSSGLGLIFHRLSSRSSGRNRQTRIVFLGACEVGKTAILARMRAPESGFPSYEPTLEDVHQFTMPLRTSYPEAVQLVDTTGAIGDEYEPMRQRAIERGHAFVVVFSVKNRSSFDRASEILKQISGVENEHIDPRQGLPVVLVGNQADEDEDDLESEEMVVSERQISSDEAWQLADSFGITEYIEMSALTGDGVDSIPRRLAVIFKGRRPQGGARAGVKASRSFHLGEKFRTLLHRSPSAADAGQHATHLIPGKKEERSKSATLSSLMPKAENTSGSHVRGFGGTLPRSFGRRRNAERSSEKRRSEALMSTQSDEPAPRKQRKGLRATLRDTFRRKKRKHEDKTNAPKDGEGASNHDTVAALEHAV